MTEMMYFASVMASRWFVVTSNSMFSSSLALSSLYFSMYWCIRSRRCSSMSSRHMVKPCFRSFSCAMRSLIRRLANTIEPAPMKAILTIALLPLEFDAERVANDLQEQDQGRCFCQVSFEAQFFIAESSKSIQFSRQDSYRRISVCRDGDRRVWFLAR